MNARFRPCFGMVLWTIASMLPVGAQLLNNLDAFPDRTKVGDPGIEAGGDNEGPKGVATADFNGDGRPDLAVSNLDGTVTLLIGVGDLEFARGIHLKTGAETLRGIIAADLNGDSQIDIATAAPLEGKVYLFWNQGRGTFGIPEELPSWAGARNLTDGDFDGDGVRDLAVGGPGRGLRHYRGTGGGAFQVMGDLPRLSPLRPNFPKPVYSLKTIRSLDGKRDELVVMHANADRAWILGTETPTGGEALPDPTQQLKARTDVDSPVVITEFMSSNVATLTDEDGDYSDWIELFNRSRQPVQLGGWRLSDGGATWVFPQVTLAPGRFLLLYASGKNRAVPGRELHTNFKLAGEGENILLTRSDGQRAHSVPRYPLQLAGTSYGLDLLGIYGYFAQPSPGYLNNARVNSLAEIPFANLAALAISPSENAEEVEITATLEESEESGFEVEYVWYSQHEGTELRHHLMKRGEGGQHAVTLRGDLYDPNQRYQVLARIRGPQGLWQTVVVSSSEQPQGGLEVTKEGALQVVASIPSQAARSFVLGTVSGPADSGQIDLVSANRDRGTVEVRRGSGLRSRFEHAPHQRIYVPGGPRAMEIIDLDQDGWNDLIVVLRNFDLAVTYRNVNGKLVLQSEMSTGVSPRELVVADFNSDGSPDAAVINRESSDVSILKTLPNETSFVSLDQIYPTSADVSGISIVDHNEDGRDDVVQLHRASWEYTVRLSQPDGSLGPPTFYSLLGIPGAQLVEDVNNDGIRDSVTANLDRQGSVSVRLGDGQGGYGQENVYRLPGEHAGRLFALVPADFDQDGNVDLAAGYFDCRISFFKGNGDGSFTYTRTAPFVYESRVMRVADLDQDGDLDVVGAGNGGDLVVFNNPYKSGKASLLHAGERTIVASRLYVGSARFELADLNGDDDPDLVVGSRRAGSIYYGGPGLTFSDRPVSLPGIDDKFPVSSLVIGDFDGQPGEDIVASCALASCINIVSRDEDGEWLRTVKFDVPAGKYLATGDLDGDGKNDLVGVGDVLWTALSSRRTVESEPVEDEQRATGGSSVVINEINAMNNNQPLQTDGGKAVDWVEVYAPEEVNLTGWKLQVAESEEALQEGKVLEYSFPATALQGETRHGLVYFSAERRSVYHTGFKLPSQGATVRLVNRNGEEVDCVNYPKQIENVSYSRYVDGHPAFTFDAIPSPGLPNSDNGPVEPIVTFEGFDRNTLTGGGGLRVFARGNDDVGIETLMLTYARLDVVDAEPESIILYDDGQHEDGGVLDGYFSGVIEGLPADAEVQFYLEATDLSGQVVVDPSSNFVLPGEEIETWSIALSDPPQLEIHEVVADNSEGQRDEAGGTPDYVVVRNWGTSTVSLTGVQLARSFVADAEDVYRFPEGASLAPGEEAVVFADGNLAQGPMHAPFSIDRGGDRVVLMSENANGARVFIDSVDTVRLQTNVPYKRLGNSGYWTVGSPDFSQPWSGIAYDANGEQVSVLAIESDPTTIYIPDFATAERPDDWQRQSAFIGDGTLKVMAREENGVFRVLTQPLPPTLPTVEVSVGIVGKESGAVGVKVDRFGGGAPQVVLFYSEVENGQIPAEWSHQAEVGVLASTDEVVLRDLNPGSTYLVRARAENGAGVSWSEARPLQTLSSAHPDVVSASAQATTSIGTQIVGTVSSGGDPTVTIYFGSSEGGTDPANWEQSEEAFVIEQEGGYRFKASLGNLEAGQTYRYRLHVTNAAGSSWSAFGGEVTTRTTFDSLQEYLVISELNYHPMRAIQPSETGYREEDFEFIEFYNRGPVPLDLSDVSIVDGIRYNFSAATQAVINPGEFVLIVRNPHAFEARYGTGLPIIGTWLEPFNTPRLANGGERITLFYGGTTELMALSYRDNWARQSDGRGHTLARIDPSVAADPNLSTAWYASPTRNGSPGTLDRYTYDLWKTQVFSFAQLQLESFWAPEADPDGDGRNNLAEYAFRSSPHFADHGSPIEVSVVEYQGVPTAAVEFTCFFHAQDLVYVLESSPDLKTWTSRWGLRLTPQGEDPGAAHLILQRRPEGRPSMKVRLPNALGNKEHYRIKVWKLGAEQ